MDDQTAESWQGGSNLPAEEQWEPVMLLLPRFGLFMTREGVTRRFIWPGAYETRHSSRMRKPLYRHRR